MKKEWKIKKIPEAFSSKTLIERLLYTRGVTKDADIKEFLNPLSMIITHPNAFCDMPKAVERISKAIEQNEKILIYGDFDADGVTSTATLLKTFKYIGANVDYYIPHREKEGHGINFKNLIPLLKGEKKPKLIITVDCGISNVSEVDMIKTFGVDVIITDHHEAPEVLPKAIAIINPKANDALSEKLTAKQIESYTSLAGVGVAFKLAHALLEHYDKTEFIKEILPFVAVGTISDIVPLVGENRYFVTKGLELISKQEHYGLKRLLEESGCKFDAPITSENIAFGVTPRINASGRLETVEDALKVLVSENKQEIEMAIMSLNTFNKVRQDKCSETFLEADEMLKVQGNRSNAIVLFNSDWHVGIIGIVASKLVEKYYKPAFLMTLDEENKIVKCSSRGIEQVNIYDVLSANADYFEGFGGHAMAGGLSFSLEKHSFEEVKKAINKTVDEILQGQKISPKLDIDLVVQANEVDGNLISDISRLEPFGAGNQQPIFVLYNMKLLKKRTMGKDNNHLRLTIEDNNHNILNAVWWGRGDISLQAGDVLDVAFYPQLNTFNGETTVQLVVQDVHADNLVEEETNFSRDIKIYDHREKIDIIGEVENYLKGSKLTNAVFCESKIILNKLKPYKKLSEQVFGRNNIKEVESLMFFDYPPCQEVLDEILDKTKAKKIHFMSYEQEIFAQEEFLKTFSGMLKFASNSKDGKFDISRAASFLATSNDVVLSALNMFEVAGMINIEEKSIEEYKIKYQSDEISKLLHTQEYSEFITEVKLCDDFKESLLEAPLSEFIN